MGSKLGEIPVPKNKLFDMDTVLERGLDKQREMRLLIREVSKKQRNTSANVRGNKMK